MMTFDTEGLLDFIARGEKSPPPVFVGREDVLEDIEAAGETVWDDDPNAHGVPGMTRIVQGAPGAGKTSILAELARRSAERDGAPRQSRVVTVGSSELLESLPDVLRAVAAAASLPQQRWRDVFRNLTLSLDAGIPSASLDIAWPTHVPAPQTLSELARRCAPATWQAPVIVAVDEAQALPGPAHEPHALFLQGIHNAVKGMPLSLVLAGLGDTREAAHEMDLTRGTTIHEVDGLDAADCATLMQGFCRHFGMDPAGHEARLDALAAPCEGWPRHLHFAMQALAEEALRREGDLASVDWAWIGNEAAESRTRYYSGQQSAAMAGSASLVAGVMQSLVPGMKLGDVRDTIWRLERDNRDESLQWRLPEGLDVDGFYTHLVHRGALQERADHTVHCPIPSFRTHLVRAGRLDPDAGPDERRTRDGASARSKLPPSL